MSTSTSVRVLVPVRDSEHTDVACLPYAGRPLATNFPITAGEVNITVPDVASRDDYVIVCEYPIPSLPRYHPFPSLVSHEPRLTSIFYQCSVTRATRRPNSRSSPPRSRATSTCSKWITGRYWDPGRSDSVAQSHSLVALLLAVASHT